MNAKKVKALRKEIGFDVHAERNYTAQRHPGVRAVTVTCTGNRSFYQQTKRGTL